MRVGEGRRRGEGGGEGGAKGEEKEGRRRRRVDGRRDFRRVYGIRYRNRRASPSFVRGDRHATWVEYTREVVISRATRRGAVSRLGPLLAPRDVWLRVHENRRRRRLRPIAAGSVALVVVRDLLAVGPVPVLRARARGRGGSGGVRRGARRWTGAPARASRYFSLGARVTDWRGKRGGTRTSGAASRRTFHAAPAMRPRPRPMATSVPT